MDDLKMRFYTPVVTGTPHIGVSTRVYPANNAAQTEQTSFAELLKEQLSQSGGVTFSKHALKRAEENNINISAESLQRLNEGVRMADEKNLGDTLIMVDQLAFLVNVRNQTVITAMNSGEKASIFTHIDGTVIV